MTNQELRDIIKECVSEYIGESKGFEVAGEDGKVVRVVYRPTKERDDDRVSGKVTYYNDFVALDDHGYATNNVITSAPSSYRAMTSSEILDFIKRYNDEHPVKGKVSEGDKDMEKELRLNLQKAKKMKDIEKAAYYLQALDGYFRGVLKALTSWENFKGSWAYDTWKSKPDTVKTMKHIEDELKRFSYLHEDNDEMHEVAPPGFPKALYNKIKKQYGDTNKAYATMWKLHNKYGDKLEEFFNSVAQEKIKEIRKDVKKEATQYFIHYKGKQIWFSIFNDETDLCPPDMKIYGYNRIYLKTKKTPAWVCCHSREDFKLLLEYWNLKAQGGNYEYEADPQGREYTNGDFSENSMNQTPVAEYKVQTNIKVGDDVLVLALPHDKFRDDFFGKVVSMDDETMVSVQDATGKTYRVTLNQVEKTID